MPTSKQNISLAFDYRLHFVVCLWTIEYISSNITTLRSHPNKFSTVKSSLPITTNTKCQFRERNKFVHEPLIEGWHVYGVLACFHPLYGLMYIEKKQTFIILSQYWDFQAEEGRNLNTKTEKRLPTPWLLDNTTGQKEHYFVIHALLSFGENERKRVESKGRSESWYFFFQSDKKREVNFPFPIL